MSRYLIVPDFDYLVTRTKLFLHFESTSPERRTSAPRRRSCACARPTRRRTPSRSSTRSPRTWTRRTTPAVRDPGRSASTGGGGSLCPMGAWWLPAIVMQCGSGVGRPREWRGVGADHRPEVRAEGNATAVCSAQSSASGLRCGDSDVFSSQQSS